MVQQHATPWDLPTLLRDVPGRKDFARPLAPLTSIRIGGPADALVRIETVNALRCLQAVARQHAIPLFILGGGRTCSFGMAACAALSCCYAGLFARAV